MYKSKIFDTEDEVDDWIKGTKNCFIVNFETVKIIKHELEHCSFFNMAAVYKMEVEKIKVWYKELPPPSSHL